MVEYDFVPQTSEEQIELQVVISGNIFRTEGDISHADREGGRGIAFQNSLCGGRGASSDPLRGIGTSGPELCSLIYRVITAPFIID